MEWKFDSGAPIYSQIVDILRARIVSGDPAPGERLPAVREMALTAGVNPNTMQRALTELEREGLLFTQRTSGRFVTEDRETLTRVKEELAKGRLRAFLADMRELGIRREELRTLLENENIFEKEEK